MIGTLFTLFIILSGCSSDSADDGTIKGYNLTAPDVSITLPDTLHEISGITSIGSGTIACVQDEHGIIFIYDLIKNEIIHYFFFYWAGDYEGIARAGQSLYVLRSDGTIFEIADYTSSGSELESVVYEIGIPSGDNEGLCYDGDNNRLLIACKGKVGKKDENKDKRFIYAFDLKSKKLIEDPVFSIDVGDIRHLAVNNKIDLPTKKNKKGEKKEHILKFSISEICIHPVTKELFLLSATDHLLFVFNMKGKILHIVQLDHDLFYQPEGLTFFDNGDMLISNEGQDLEPTLLRFIYRKI